MKSTAQKLILISFVLAVIFAMVIFLFLNSLKPTNKIAKATAIKVIVAAKTIPPRTIIDKSMIKEIQVENNTIFADYIKDSSKIVGKYSKETIYANEGFSSSKLLDKNGNELSFKIDSDHRAISITVTGDSGVSDLLKVGDYVDIINYVSEKKDGNTVVRPEEAKIILQNVQLLAVNKQINRDDKVSDSGNTKNTTSNSSNNDKAQTSFLVTLSILTTDIEKLVLAESIGTIKLALRPIQSSGTIQTNGTTWKELAASPNQDSSSGSENSSSQGSNSQSSNTQKYNSYTVREGDTLKIISKQFYGDESKYPIIKEANNIQDENMIITGETIKVPILQ